MVCTLQRATDAEIERLVREPEQLAPFMSNGRFGPQSRHRVKRTLLDRLFSRPLPPEPARMFPSQNKEDDTFDLDKTWDALNFCLVGQNPDGPLRYLKAGGMDIDAPIFAQGIVAKQVVEFHEALSTTTKADIERRFRTKEFAASELYPDADFWNAPDMFDYLRVRFEEFKPFVEVTRNRNLGLIVSIG